MKRLGNLTVLAFAAAAAPAAAATGPLQVPPDGFGPGEVAFPLDAAWQHPKLPATAPVSTNGRYELRTSLSDGATCIRGAIVLGVTVRPANRPVLAGGTLRLHPEGRLLPRMKVERHGTAGRLSWFAGPLTASPAVVDGVHPPLEQGIAVLPAPPSTTHAGRSLAVVRVLLDARVEHLAADGSTVQSTPAEADECFTPVRAQIGAQLRTILRKVSVRRRS
jgi:hypothetical protein